MTNVTENHHHMKVALYHREREWAREMGDPKLSEVEAPSNEEAERLTAHLGTTGTITVRIHRPAGVRSTPMSGAHNSLQATAGPPCC